MSIIFFILGDLDLWFRVRSSINRWVDNGVDHAPGSGQTEFATERWCVWGHADMRDENGDSTLPDDFPGFSDLDGNFAKWDIYASNLVPPPTISPSFGKTILKDSSFFS